MVPFEIILRSVFKYDLEEEGVFEFISKDIANGF